VILILSAALAATTPAEQDDTIVMLHDISPKYNLVDYESACGSTVFRVRFRNGPDQHGQVDRVTVDGREVAGAAELLKLRAARRVIDRVGIMNCGMDPHVPVFRGILRLSESESRSLGMRWMLFFRLAREGRDGWRLTID
jgi:hypothetical protein